MKADEWLRVTAELQQHYGYPLSRLEDHDERLLYTAANLAAAFVELGEVGQEVDFRPWKDVAVTRERVRDEIVDTMHFLANLLYAHNVSDDEFWTAYAAKVKKNRTRADHKHAGDE